MAKMRAVQVSRANGPLELVERDVPTPAAGQVRIKVQACGVCHSDSFTVEGAFGVGYPRIPGHEVVGVVDAVGADVPRWKAGDRVGVGWSSGNCGYCDPCRSGNAFACGSTLGVTGIHYDGGYAEYMTAPASAVAAVPDALSSIEAAPLMCAGLTTFNALRNSGARPGDLVAVLGLGGLGHLGVQYAVKMGFHTVVIARGADKAPLATKLGAVAYIDSKAEDPAAALQKLGGAKVVLATATSGEAMKATMGGLGPTGTLMVLGAAEPFLVDPVLLLSGSRSVKGWYSGTSIDAQQTLSFSALTGVRAMEEVLPLEKADEGYHRMMSGGARFRVVLTTGN